MSGIADTDIRVWYQISLVDSVLRHTFSLHPNLLKRRIVFIILRTFIFMANANFDSTSITSKAVSLVVAIVVFACVLVPVVGSMTGGGDSGGDSTVTITNTGIGFAKTDRDDAVHTMIISKDTNDKMKVTVDGQDVAVPTIPDDDFTSESQVTLGIGHNNDMIVAYKWGTVSIGDSDTGDWTQEDVTITFQNGIAYYDTDSYEIDLYRSNIADYVYCTDHAKAPLDATVYVGHWDTFKYNGITGGYICLYPDSGLMNEVVVDTTYCMGTEYGPMPSIAVAEVSTTEHYYEVSEFSTEPFSYSVYDGTDYIDVEDAVYHPGVYVPATFTYEGENAGGNTDSDSGMVGTLIGIIPVFVALGLILAIVGMFYNSKMN